MVFRKYDGATSVQELIFDRVAFWVHIHHLPFSLLTEEVPFKLGDTLCSVIRTGDLSDMRGGTFMRVRVSLNILDPICRGHRITLG